MRLKIIYFICFLLFLFATDVWAKKIILKHVYKDKAGNVHVITAVGADKQLTQGGLTVRAGLSKDRRTAAWLIENTATVDGNEEAGASKLTVYRDGNIRRIECQPFIRGYWFWEEGAKVGIDCGGSHFAGTLILYDALTGKRIESVIQSDLPYGELPAWATPDE